MIRYGILSITSNSSGPEMISSSEKTDLHKKEVAELALKRRQDLPSTIKNYGDYVVYLQNRIMADATNVEELKKSLDKCINENQ